MEKIFKLEEVISTDDIFSCFQKLARRRRDHVLRFYQSLLDIQSTVHDPIKENKKQKFVFHSMILTLQDVNTLYSFFKDHVEEFSTSK